MSIKIRPITVSDKDRWLELFKEYIVFYKSKLSDEQFELTWQRLNSGFNINGLLAEVDGKVVGFTHYIFRPSTWAVEDFCYLEDLYTDPTLRGKGVGHQILDAIIERAENIGVKRIFCLTFETKFFAKHVFAEIEGTPVEPEIYQQLLQSYDVGVAEFLDLDKVKPNTLGNTRMIKHL